MSEENNVLDLKMLPAVLVLLVQDLGGYKAKGSWGSFDALGVRSLQDLHFGAGSASRKVLYAFTAEPPHGADIIKVSLPLQVALEAAFFHIAQIDEIVLNPRGGIPGSSDSALAIPQQDLDFSIPSDFDSEVRIPKSDLPWLIGGVAFGADELRDEPALLEGAAKALQSGAFFEAYYLAKTARRLNAQSATAWFYVLFALSFFGAADEALELYEQFPGRGSADPFAQLIAARYRLLLKQFNEARTILHTLSFNAELGALALCELARSFLIEKHFARALDAASSAIKKDSDLGEAYLLRGIAQRGIAYDAGDVEGLREAYADFERLAKRGGYGAAEALYHAGTVCARLGALSEAETLFRQSLFQRDRVSARDALIRTVCAQDRREEALAELESLERLLPAYGKTLRDALGSALHGAASSTAKKSTEVRENAELWSVDVAESVATARALLSAWEVPVGNTPVDCELLDDLINRFAPDGDFPLEGRFSALFVAGHDLVARAVALHIAEILVSRGVATWSGTHSERCSVVSTRMLVEIPLENFVKERILLGASGDNFSSLESLVVELEALAPGQQHTQAKDWWERADLACLGEFKQEEDWVCDKLAGMGVALSGTLSDLESLDLWIEANFEPGGSVKTEALVAVTDNLDRFIAGLGLLVGQRIAASAEGVWFDHDKPEGVSVWTSELGRVFPVARVQRRVYLASAADFSAKLSSLAWSVAVAKVAGEVRSGKLVGQDMVRKALVEALPSVASFPEAELSGVVNSLLIGAGAA